MMIQRFKMNTLKGQALERAAAGFDNNLNLLRAVAALLVLLSHSFVLTTGNASLEPGRNMLGMSLGDIAVDIFFVVSGFLVTKSICRSGSLRRYFIARALRIFPGLWVSLVLTTLVVCFLYCSRPPIVSLFDPETWRYVWKNGAVVTGAAYSFPGAFAGNPVPDTINGSLWTLPLESWMYILLAGVWLVGTKVSWRRRPTFHWSVIALATLLAVTTLGVEAAGRLSHSLQHASMFFVAAAMFGFRSRIRLDGVIALIGLVVVVASAFGPSLLFEFAYFLTVPYMVLYLAFVPGGAIRAYNRIGDYSYGIYIYAFPIQQMVTASNRGISPFLLFLVSSMLTLICAVLSWHWVESVALMWRKRSIKRSKSTDSSVFEEGRIKASQGIQPGLAVSTKRLDQR